MFPVILLISEAAIPEFLTTDIDIQRLKLIRILLASNFRENRMMYAELDLVCMKSVQYRVYSI